MAITITRVDPSLHEETFDLTLDSSYPTGGEPLTAADLGFTTVAEVIPHGPFFYDLPRTREAQEIRERLCIEPHRKIVLWQGILFPYKGLDVLLKAWKQVEREHVAGQLVVLMRVVQG